MMAASNAIKFRPVRSAGTFLLLSVIICFLCLPSAAQSSATGSAGEYELKAAFVYNILLFVQWPPGTVSDHLVIGFAGEGAMGEALSRMAASRRPGATHVEVREVHNRNEMRFCQVLYVDYRQPSRVRDALAQVKDANVLTISDGEPFVQAGGIIALIPFNGKFQIGVNTTAAERAHLSISSKLLSIAKPVFEDKSADR